ncbi:MAG: hypothetical protein IJU37_08565 [Desulfovibrio sp.]|nr:hypothetical protein [Desulfovibrio sp.]
MSQLDVSRTSSFSSVSSIEAQQPNNVANNNLPQELQNARPSSSGWATFGRVMLGIARVLGAIATIGISELIIHVAKPSPKPPQPRAQITSQQTVPSTKPSDDITKDALANTIQKNLNDLGNIYKRFLLDALDTMDMYFDDNVPRNLDELQNFTLSNGKKFVEELADQVRKVDGEVTGAKLWMMVKPLLSEEMSRRVVHALLQAEAQKLDIELKPNAVPQATEKLLQECTKQIENTDGMPNENEKNIKTFLSYIQADENDEIIPTTDMVKDAFNNIKTLVDMSKILQPATT